MQLAARKAARSLALSQRCLAITRRGFVAGGDPGMIDPRPSKGSRGTALVPQPKGGDRNLVEVADRVVAIEPLEWQREEDGQGSVYCESSCVEGRFLSRVEACREARREARRSKSQTD